MLDAATRAPSKIQATASEWPELLLQVAVFCLRVEAVVALLVVAMLRGDAVIVSRGVVKACYHGEEDASEGPEGLY